jgi:ADP-ribose pyrophosphatase YjhB (NUDIX family)/predicted transcriptional regulator
MEIKIHEFQLSILRELLFKPEAKFSELKKIDIENDHFSFHINHLLKKGLIIKKDAKYSLTDSGKEFANRMDTDSLRLEKQAKLCIAITAVRMNKNVAEYLVHHRLKEPFYGWYGTHSGKIRWGENPEDCAKREFLEESGLTGDFSLKQIAHYQHYHKDGRLLEDKYFWVFRVDNVKGDFKEKVPEGENVWLTEKEYRKLKNTFATVDEVLHAINNKKLEYVDRVRIVESY